MISIGSNNGFRFSLNGAADSAIKQPNSHSNKEDATSNVPGTGGALPATESRDQQKKTVKEQQKQQAIDGMAQKLAQTENRVIAHEQAHMAAGGDLAGGASYTYTRGPDGKMYITGGEVGISMPIGDTPEETVANMERVQRAALAPADPSPQDLRVASAAAMVAQQARAFMQKQKIQENNPYMNQQIQANLQLDRQTRVDMQF